MKIVCVDDEMLVLGLTVSMCRELPQKPEVNGFDNAHDALAFLQDHPVDIVMLDINMPDMDGITLAMQIKRQHPDTAIIFLTGYSEYAVDAFAVHASGYLLKPVSKERLASEVAYVLERRAPKNSTARILVKTFGEFEVYARGETVHFSRERSKELLAYLVDRQGGGVTRANAFAVLWEDEVYDRRMQKQFDVIVRSLAATLEEYGIGDMFEMNKGQLRVVPQKFDCDLYHFIKGEPDYINAYRGEYMSSYSWASLTEAYMDRIKSGH